MNCAYCESENLDKPYTNGGGKYTVCLDCKKTSIVWSQISTTETKYIHTSRIGKKSNNDDVYQLRMPHDLAKYLRSLPTEFVRNHLQKLR